MSDLLYIDDPRKNDNLGSESSLSDQSESDESAIINSQLHFGFVYKKGIKITPESLLNGIFNQFPSDYIFFSVDEPGNYTERILKCFQPDLGYEDTSPGILTYSNQNIEKAVTCFNRHCN